MAKIFTITEGLENMGALRSGGQGSVYKGKRMGPILSAVKLLPTPIYAENTDDKNFRDFQNEVEKLKKVNEAPSPHVVKILNSGLTESGSLPFIEMEYIEGPDLEDLLKPPHKRVFSVRDTIKLAEQLAAALAHCHKVGVKHGDIKSNNIKFNNDTGNYILLDFGLAVMSDEQRRSSIRNAGAVEFMAPEQYEGKMLFQSDIYSYGVVLYELLTGTVPFPLINKHESARNLVMLAHMEKEVPDVRELRRAQLQGEDAGIQQVEEMDIPGWLSALIGRCLMKDPEQRFANGMELYQAVCSGIESRHAGHQPEPAELEKLKSEMVVLNAELDKYRSVIRLKWVIGALVIILLGLSLYGTNALLESPEGIKTDSSAVVTETGTAADSLRQSTEPVKKLPPGQAKKPAANKNADPAKNKKTKDGLVDDVPYF